MSATASSRGPTPPPTSPRLGSPQLRSLSASELTEALKNTGMSAPYNPLLQAVEATGRTRGSPATPILQKARPSLPTGTNIGSMTEGDNYHLQPYGYRYHPPVNHLQRGLRNQTYNNQPRQSQQFALSNNQRFPRVSSSSQSSSYNQQKISSFRSAIVRASASCER